MVSKKKIVILAGAVLLVLFLLGCAEQNNGTKVSLYKDPECGCCVGHAAFLTSSSFNVDTILTENMAAIKQQYGIPSNMQSCHTSIIEGYFVEGHVPIATINKLLLEKPDIDGIALPGMPSGSPGMPGAKTEVWKIFAIKDGVVQGIFEEV